jgi:site-specific recombinase XerD
VDYCGCLEIMTSPHPALQAERHTLSILYHGCSFETLTSNIHSIWKGEIKMNLCDAIDEYLGSKQNSLTHKSFTWYTQRLTAFEAWCRSRKLTDLTQITAPHVQQFIQTVPSTNTYTRHGYVQVVKGFLNWCSQDEEMGVRERVVRRIELPKIEVSEVEIFTDGEIMKLFRACERMPYPHRAKAIVHLLLDTGLRASEICYDGTRPEEQTGLRMEHLVMGSSEDSYVWVMGKGRKSRTVGLGNETRMALKRYLHRERGRCECEYVFLSRRDEPLSVRMLEQFVKDLGGESGLENCYPHRFRHTFAVNQLMQGTSDLVLMRLMGHTSLEATKVYTRAMTQLQARKASFSVVDRIKRGG